MAEKKSLLKKIALGIITLAAAAVIAISGGAVDWLQTGKDAINGEASNTVQKLEDFTPPAE